MSHHAHPQSHRRPTPPRETTEYYLADYYSLPARGESSSSSTPSSSNPSPVARRQMSRQNLRTTEPRSSPTRRDDSRSQPQPQAQLRERRAPAASSSSSSRPHQLTVSSLTSDKMKRELRSDDRQPPPAQYRRPSESASRPRSRPHLTPINTNIHPPSSGSSSASTTRRNVAPEETLAVSVSSLAYQMQKGGWINGTPSAPDLTPGDASSARTDSGYAASMGVGGENTAPLSGGSSTYFDGWGTTLKNAVWGEREQNSATSAENRGGANDATPIWDRLNAAKDVLSSSVNVTIARAKALREDDEDRIDESGNTKLSRRMKTYYIEKATTSRDLPRWLFSEDELLNRSAPPPSVRSYAPPSSSQYAGRARSEGTPRSPSSQSRPHLQQRSQSDAFYDPNSHHHAADSRSYSDRVNAASVASRTTDKLRAIKDAKRVDVQVAGSGGHADGRRIELSGTRERERIERLRDHQQRDRVDRSKSREVPMTQEPSRSRAAASGSSEIRHLNEQSRNVAFYGRERRDEYDRKMRESHDDGRRVRGYV